MKMDKKEIDQLHDAITKLQRTIWELMESKVNSAETNCHIDWIEAETADSCNFLRSGFTMSGSALSMLNNVLYDIYHRCHKVSKDPEVPTEIKKKIKENVEEIRNLFILD
jgi:hypothetical protein